MQLRLFETTLRLYMYAITVRYAGTLLGPLWIVLFPLTFTTIIGIVFSQFFQNNSFGVPYFIFVLLGFISWNFFSQTIVQMSQVFFNHRQLVKNTTIPLLAIPLSVALIKLTDFVLLSIIVVAITVIQGYTHPSLSMLLIPIVMVAQLCFQVGIGLLVSLATTHLRDVGYLVELLLQLLFYASPVVYELHILPNPIQDILSYNPISVFLHVFRSLILSSTFSAAEFTTALALGFVSLTLGIKLFLQYKHTLVEAL